MKRFLPDSFVLILLGTVTFASLLPVRGDAVYAATVVMMAAVFLLFFLHGLRLPRADVVSAMRNWRLQLVIYLFVFAAMPLAGQIAGLLAAPLLPAAFVTGLMFLTILPSTVQSAISYSSIGGGNVAASIMAAALSNLSAIFLTPLLLFLLIGSSSDNSIGIAIIGKIAGMLLLPFMLGQIAQKWLGPWALERRALISGMDKAAIAIAVYVAFSASVVGGIWKQVDAAELTILVAFVVCLLGYGFGTSWLTGKLLRLPRADRITLFFAGAHKSMVTGAPLAAVLFAPGEAGAVILPALIYHQLQLIISAPLANRMARSDDF